MKFWLAVCLIRLRSSIFKNILILIRTYFRGLVSVLTISNCSLSGKQEWKLIVFCSFTLYFFFNIQSLPNLTTWIRIKQLIKLMRIRILIQIPVTLLVTLLLILLSLRVATSLAFEWLVLFIRLCYFLPAWLASHCCGSAFNSRGCQCSWPCLVLLLLFLTASVWLVFYVFLSSEVGGP